MASSAGYRKEAEEAAVVEEGEEEESGWSDLPDLVMERVLGYLTMRERYYASLVCTSWNRAFYLPRAWSVFVFNEETLTRRRFNYYTGWQYILDHLRTQLCLSTVGMHFKVLVFSPMTNFYNMYEFMNMISFYAEQEIIKGANCIVQGIGSKVHTLKYTFPCNMSQRQESERERLYGTGGKLLAAVKRLMSNLGSLRTLELTDLMLDNYEALCLLDQVCYDRCLTLRTLRLVNPTKTQCQLLHVGVFLNLQVLVISPHNLGEEVLYLVGESSLRHLGVVQNRYTPVEVAPMSARAWAACARLNPALRVHLSLESLRERQILWQERAPVATLLYSSPQCRLQGEIVTRATEWYRQNLCVFGHLGLPRFHQPKSFNERMDPFLLMLCKECPKLQTLVLGLLEEELRATSSEEVRTLGRGGISGRWACLLCKIIRERVSTATVVLLAEHGRGLRRLVVRRNAVVLRCDWPRNPDWSGEYFAWLRTTSRSYLLTEAHVSSALGYSWHMLSDQEFKAFVPDVYVS